MTCPGGGFVPVGTPCNAPLTAASAGAGLTTAASTTPSTGSVTPAPGFQVSLASGWNIVAGPQGATLSPAGGSLFTFQAGDQNYETAAATTPLKAGVGYWLYVAQPMQVSLPTTSTGTATIPLPAGQFVMIGNPGTGTATVAGADTVLAYNPTSATYTQTTQLLPGQGAWAMSNAGGQATITSSTAGQASMDSESSG
jgi:hypothetical protein